MIVTIDTNVIYQALYSSKGASHAILRLVRSGDLRLALSIPVFEEYCDVLHRPATLTETGLNREEIEAVLDFLAHISLQTKVHFLYRPNLRDEADNMFVELALASGSTYMITRNVKDYKRGNELRFDSFKIVTPSEFLALWRDQHEN